MVTDKIIFKALKNAPSPKEVDYWIDTASNPNGGEIKYYNNGQWVSIKSSDMPNDTNKLTVTNSIAFLPISTDMIVADINTSSSFSLASIPSAGKEIHTVIKNNSEEEIVITLPTAEPYVCMSNDNLTVTANGYAEVNAISDGTKIYLRSI